MGTGNARLLTYEHTWKMACLLDVTSPALRIPGCRHIGGVKFSVIVRTRVIVLENCSDDGLGCAKNN
jgi:hypothetical protein